MNKLKRKNYPPDQFGETGKTFRMRKCVLFRGDFEYGYSLRNIKVYFSKRFYMIPIPFSPRFSRGSAFCKFFGCSIYIKIGINYPVTRFSKVKNFLDYIDLKFTQNFVPGKEICG